VIVLHELGGDTVIGKGLRAVAFREEAPVIARADGGNHEDAGKRGSLEFEM